jgi:polyferredoxin
MHRNRIASRINKVSIVRRIAQFISAIGINSYIPDIKNFSIYQGSTKSLCAPGLNCYACPFARTSCPIGSLQHFVVIRQFPYYILGYIGLVGIAFGRAFCGWLCPFGLLQELIKKITSFRLKIKQSWGILKYVVLLVMIPVVYFTNEPWFCKLCPAGTIEGTFPIMLSPLWTELSKLITFRFFIKLAIAIVFILLFVVIRRPFCRYMCPLGAMWGLFNKISFVRMKVDNSRCLKCDLCQEVCPMDIKIYEDPNHFDCIRCLKCVYVCPQKVIEVEVGGVPLIKPELNLVVKRQKQ